jgi:DNA-binding MarR family transcriptional regulator
MGGGLLSVDETLVVRDDRDGFRGVQANRRWTPVADDPRWDIPQLLRSMNVELDAVGSRFAEMHDLGRTDVRALIAIMDAARGGGALTAGGLGAAVELSSASVTALVDRLERAGHVRRARDPEDRRRVVLEMTEPTMAAGAEYFGGLQAALVRVMAGYTDEELAVVRRFLAAATEAIVRHERPGAEPAGRPAS